jgi:hypothetical protein
MSLQSINGHHDYSLRDYRMTLVAAFKNRGVPLLLGDFLLTDKHRRASGLRKKIHLLSSNLAVGWTGAFVTAKTVLTDLHQEFRESRLTHKDVEYFLSHYPHSELGSGAAHLVGWVVDDKPRCFLWNSESPERLHYDDNIADGTGEETFRAILASGGGSGATSPSASKLDAAVRYALFVSSHLMSDEVLEKRNQRAGFGHAYEILYYNGTEFRYVNKVIYSFCDLNLISDFQSRKPVIYTFFRYSNIDAHSNHSILEVCKLERDDRTFHLITPIFETGRGEVEYVASTGVFENRGFTSIDYYLCLLVRYLTRSNDVFLLPVIIPPNSQDPPAVIRTFGKQTHIALHVQYLLNTYKKFRTRTLPDNLELALRHFGPGVVRDMRGVFSAPSPGTITLRWRMGKRSSDMMLVDFVGGVFENRISIISRQNRSIQVRVFDGLGRRKQITSRPYKPNTVLQIAVVWEKNSVTLWIQGKVIGNRVLLKFSSNWLSLLIGIDIEGEASADKVRPGYTVDGITGLSLQKDHVSRGARLTERRNFYETTLSQKN